MYLPLPTLCMDILQRKYSLSNHLSGWFRIVITHHGNEVMAIIYYYIVLMRLVWAIVNFVYVCEARTLITDQISTFSDSMLPPF